MLNWFIDLFTLDHLGYFLLGVASAAVWHYLKAQIQRRILVIKWQYIAVPFALAIVLYTAVQNQQNADCVREFNHVLRERASVTTQNDQISIEQRELIYTWIHALIFPPPDIAALHDNHPLRRDYALRLTIATDMKFAELIEKQREYERVRAANPLPPPTCGL
ncbi:hypothetical protein [Mycolicibacterium sp. XJ1819]